MLAALPAGSGRKARDFLRLACGVWSDGTLDGLAEGVWHGRSGRDVRARPLRGRLRRALLYDEVKPLSDRLCLGIGGLDLTGEPGEMFFFGLERR